GEQWLPVAFLSKAMNETQRNYEIYDKELLAIMTALDSWRHLLMGAREEFEIYTDHKNLDYFRKPQKLNGRQARWMTQLANYNYSLHHRPGASMKKADSLSRRPDHNRGEKDNENLTLLKPQHFRANTFHLLPTVPSEYLNQIKSARKNIDKTVQKALDHKEKG